MLLQLIATASMPPDGLNCVQGFRLRTTNSCTFMCRFCVNSLEIVVELFACPHLSLEYPQVLISPRSGAWKNGASSKTEALTRGAARTPQFCFHQPSYAMKYNNGKKLSLKKVQSEITHTVGT